MGLTPVKQTSHPGISVSEADAGSAIFQAFLLETDDVDIAQGCLSG